MFQVSKPVTSTNNSHHATSAGCRQATSAADNENRRLVDMINSPRLSASAVGGAGSTNSTGLFSSPTTIGSTAKNGSGGSNAAAFSATVSGGCDDNDDMDRYKKRTVRDMHNILERQRRIDLRNAFDTLKGHLPDLQKTDKASKIMILTRAAEYCGQLTRTEAELRGSIRSEKLNHQNLVKKLSQLKKK